MGRRKRIATISVDAVWDEAVVPGLMKEAEHIREIITNTLALRGTRHYQELGLKTLLKCWEQQFQSLLLYAQGSEPVLREEIYGLLRKRRDRLIELRERLRAS
jgi:hypothetical protein